MKSIKIGCLLIFLLSSHFERFSQSSSEFINGVLLDSVSKEPFVFATIRLKNKALGVISNNDGGFKIPAELGLQGEILEISCMGYNLRYLAF